MHWHTPPEHRIDGQLYDAELHLVHRAKKDGSITVVAILYQFGTADKLLTKIESKLGGLSKEKCKSSEHAHIGLGTFDPKQLKKSIRKYYRYTDSFTILPCIENVIQHILGKVRSISKQVEALKAPLDSAYKNNSRPTPQALNGRKVELYDEKKK